MRPIFEEFQTYCRELLGVRPTTTAWKAAHALPIILREAYDLCEARILNTSLLLAADKRKEEVPPGVVKKQFVQLAKRWDQNIVYMRPSITSFNRQRLIRSQIPFVVPGTQMYLPMLGMDLRERFAAAKKRELSLSPSTQVLILYLLNHGTQGEFTPGVLAKVLGYTAMTLTRAFAELELHKIGTQTKARKVRKLSFLESRKDLWKKALPLLRSPMKERHFVEGNPRPFRLMTAGLTALARSSMLDEPASPVYACDGSRWKELKHELKEIPYAEEGAVQLEVWRYRPELLTTGNTVDPFSLYLTLKDEVDERVLAALDLTIENIQW